VQPNLVEHFLRIDGLRKKLDVVAGAPNGCHPADTTGGDPLTIALTPMAMRFLEISMRTSGLASQ
jgi:hypothetical protein